MSNGWIRGICVSARTMCRFGGSAAMVPRKRNKPPTVEQLRDAIDSGRTGDKVAHPDPAAAPLGTDDEAGGNPPGHEQIRGAMRQERSHDPDTSVHTAPPGRPPRQDELACDLKRLWDDLRHEPVPDRLTEAARRLERALKQANEGTRGKT